MSSPQRIVPGLTVSHSGQATIDPSIRDTLFDLALALEGPTQLPVDIEHVVAAMVLASRHGELDADTPIDSSDTVLAAQLVPHIRTVFKMFGGIVGED
tara:strand:- start:77828 stop:78121 length:294 start_codon:yes stop_codon:yes gene_type:complete